jgi:hypothetical protein
LGLPWLIVYLSSEWTSVSFRSTRAKRVPKPLTPRPPDDCPDCQLDPAHSIALGPAEPPPPPWRAVKSPRGRPKSIDTAGYACLNPACAYRLMTDVHVHALVGDGTHGRDRIQDLVCQACGRKFSVRCDTALYRLRTPARLVAMVLALFAEGASV